MKKHYDEATAAHAVAKKCTIDLLNKVINVPVSSGTIGNGTWGKIDYLCHYCGYRWIKTSNVIVSVGDKAVKHRKRNNNYDEEETVVKFSKKRK